MFMSHYATEVCKCPQIITRILLKNLARHYRASGSLDHIAAINLDRTEHIAASISQFFANLVSVRYRGPVFYTMEKIIRVIVISHKMVRQYLDWHIVPAPDIICPFKKRPGDLISVEDFGQSPERYGTALPKQGGKEHPVALVVLNHIIGLFSSELPLALAFQIPLPTVLKGLITKFFKFILVGRFFLIFTIGEYILRDIDTWQLFYFTIFV